jgi:hypothetical protein
MNAGTWRTIPLAPDNFWDAIALLGLWVGSVFYRLPFAAYCVECFVKVRLRPFIMRMELQRLPEMQRSLGGVTYHHICRPQIGLCC